VKVQYQTIIISVLACCLAVVIAFYLHSVYKTPATVSITPNKVDEATKASSQSSLQNTKQSSSSLSVVVPDKSLPIPAHQLKKIIADPEKITNSELKNKIDSVNNSIAEIDQRLLKNSGSDNQQKIVTDKASGNLTVKPSEVEQRLQNIKRHLETQKQ